MLRRYQYFAVAAMLTVAGCSGQKSAEEEKLPAKDDAEVRNAPEDRSIAMEPSDVELDRLTVPACFKIDLFATDVEEARSLALGDNGTVFVGNRREDKVYALVDTDGDQKADKKYVIAEGLNMPNGVAFKDGDLYVAEVNKIWKYANIEDNLNDPGEPELIYGEYPDDTHHGWKFIAFGPDDKLYVPVGAPCNICEPEKEIYATITRMNADGTDMEIIAHGIRNSVGFDWNPEDNSLWFTNNGRDMLGDDIPSDEINRISEEGEHFGYPYWHAGDVKDPEFGDKRKQNEFTAPKHKPGAHRATLGMRFYTGDMFPGDFQNAMIVAEHGSWNRSEKTGYRVARGKISGTEVDSYETLVEGWLDKAEDEAWGRPVDVMQMPDGALLISDDHAGVIYRLSYEG